MSPADHENQARAFLAYFHRRGGSWEAAWHAWAGSKDFAVADYLAIRNAVHEILFSEGVTTDPPPMAA